MTYTIKFVNFTLGALFQNHLRCWWGVRMLPALYGSYAHVLNGMIANDLEWVWKTLLSYYPL